MRTLEGQGLNRTARGSTSQVCDHFKDETVEGAQDGTPLVERNGLADVYYAMVDLLRRAGVTPDESSENRYRTSPQTHNNQIWTALNILFANKAIETVVEDNFSRSEVSNSNINLRAAITALSALVNGNYSAAATADSNANLRAAITTLTTLVNSNFTDEIRINSNAYLRTRFDALKDDMIGTNGAIPSLYTALSQVASSIPRRHVIFLESFNINVSPITAITNLCRFSDLSISAADVADFSVLCQPKTENLALPFNNIHTSINLSSTYTYMHHQQAQGNHSYIQVLNIPNGTYNFTVSIWMK